MARGNPAKWLLTGWRRWILVAVVVLILLSVAWSIYGKDIQVRSTLGGYAEDPQETERTLLAYGLPYRPALRRALLGGGREFPVQYRFSRLMQWEPFFDGKTLDRALASEDPVVARAAASAILNFRRTSPPTTVPDEVMSVLEDWAEELAAPYLGTGLGPLSGYRDPRVAKMLARMIVARSEDKVDGVVEIGRANGNREVAARQLRTYVFDPMVVEALRTVATRDVESPIVQMHAIKALAGGGYTGDFDIYWKGARSDNVFVRQALAADLESVRSPEVIPILLYLTNDANEVVRRHAVDALMDRRAPDLMNGLEYLAEDWFASIAGDLAWAVRHYRRDDKIPYVVHCLKHTDPVVVEKAMVVLFALTRKHYGFTEKTWKQFVWDMPLMAGEKGRTRSAAIREFMNDEDRKKQAIAGWNEVFPPAYTDQDHLPHLIRQLGHADSRNVRRAMRELKRFTGRTEGLPAACLDPNADITEEANAIHKFMIEDKEQVIAEWERWLAEQE